MQWYTVTTYKLINLEIFSIMYLSHTNISKETLSRNTFLSWLSHPRPESDRSSHEEIGWWKPCWDRPGNTVNVHEIILNTIDTRKLDDWLPESIGIQMLRLFCLVSLSDHAQVRRLGWDWQEKEGIYSAFRASIEGVKIGQTTGMLRSKYWLNVIDPKDHPNAGLTWM